MISLLIIDSRLPTHTASRRDLSLWSGLVWFALLNRRRPRRGTRIAGCCRASDDWMLMRRCPATRALGCISALWQPLKWENDDGLMSVNFGSARDGSSAQKSLPGEVTAVHILHMKARGGDPGSVSGHAHPFLRRSNGCAKGSKRAEGA